MSESTRSTQREIVCYRQLRVWKAGMDLAEQIYQHSRNFPKYEV
jgi:hypothetical protein